VSKANKEGVGFEPKAEITK